MEAILQFFVDWGYPGLFLAAFIAGTVLPFSSEAAMLLLVQLGLDPVWCVLTATAGNTLGGMTCYWIGTRGKTEWVVKLGVSNEKLERAKKFLSGRGAMMAFFSFLPTIGEAIAIALGLLRSNVWLTAGSMAVGKGVRYLVIMTAFQGIIKLF